ncbi:MAG: hypothetical protein Q7J86_03600 [Bacteroidota bacterium]|nr:hypothetical protein [Bacteroidota bacterium]MDO9613594.1 hypothetical protein [Bacteroidota bacterium]
MRKFSANYLVSEDGVYLKNGILEAGEDGFAIKYIDTKGDLREIAQLTFLNGILMAGFRFIKTDVANFYSGQPLETMVMKYLAETTQLSIYELIDLGKLVQLQFPEIKTPEILNKITSTLQTYGGFSMESQPGIYLLSGADLVNLHFTSKSQLKKIL